MTFSRRSPKRCARLAGCQASRLPPACSSSGGSRQLMKVATTQFDASHANPRLEESKKLFKGTHADALPPTCPAGGQAAQQDWPPGLIKARLKLGGAHAAGIWQVRDAGAAAAAGCAACCRRCCRGVRQEGGQVYMAAVPAPAAGAQPAGGAAGAAVGQSQACNSEDWSQTDAGRLPAYLQHE